MNKFIQQIFNILLSLLTIASLSSNAFALNVDDEKEQKHKVKHKVIEVQRHTDKPVMLEIVENGEAKVIEISSDELSDDEALADKLSILDEDTKNTVLNIINNSSQMDTKELSVFTKSHNSDAKLEFIKNKEVVVISDDEDLSFSGKLKGHHSAIVKLIEKGEFSREELDEIRAALDAKY